MQNYHKLIVYASLIPFMFSSQAFACFPGYQKPDNDKIIAAIPKTLEEHQQQNFIFIQDNYPEDYSYKVSLENTNHLNWQLIWLRMENKYDSTQASILTALYPYKSEQIKGHILLEKVAYLDYCNTKKYVDAMQHGKTQQENYLRFNLEPGFSLDFYAQPEGNSISQIAVLTTPMNETEKSVTGFSSKRFIVMRANYPKLLEDDLKPYIQQYFSGMLPVFMQQGKMLLDESE